MWPLHFGISHVSSTFLHLMHGELSSPPLCLPGIHLCHKLQGVIEACSFSLQNCTYGTQDLHQRQGSALMIVCTLRAKDSWWIY